ncbi:phage tail sheath subtilisin-like domain-containing protein [Lysinibacillus xylanilyticus]|uniref:Phage tail sheath subtilisin-like domain-containing protein n=1 Tax=Lysinibacillus xylanilyticus TaxID=582475 RepID=A0ABT4EM83_9BACI|nr:phage tail sheath subtilisin-like domain-containing protein [Lysinibacillus xylanilyticus]MCY9546780.1 phage tail sheath subtilisin-like domain-containing protein [Lysinibacillus xylanilyticus]
MANGGQWEATSLPVRPGLYINFRDAAIASITGGSRGTVAVPIFTYGGTAESGKFYTIETVSDGIELVGNANSTPITRILQGGAKEVLVYAVPALVVPEEGNVQYANLRDALSVQDFNVFVYPTVVDATEQTATKSWVESCREEGKHFMYVAGGDAASDADIESGNARSILLKDPYIVNLVTGVILADGREVQSADYAPFIAGLIAGTPINKSITYAELPIADVTLRLKNSQVNKALISGSLVIIKDGNKVRIEQGITTDSNAGERGKIRKTRAKQAIATDIPATARDSYIGKVDNNPLGQASLIGAIKGYLELMETDNVLMDPQVALDSRYKSEGDKVFLAVNYKEVDSMERIFLTITV